MFEFSDKILLDVKRVSGRSEIFRYVVSHVMLCLVMFCPVMF